MKYHFKIHREGEFFWAQCIELEGCVTQAYSLKALHENMQEALNLYIQESEDSVDLAALPDHFIRKTKNIVEIPVDPQIAFAFMVRYYRIQHGLTQKEAAKLMGFDSLYSYQRLEAKRCNPSLKILHKIKQVFPELSIDFAVGS